MSLDCLRSSSRRVNMSKRLVALHPTRTERSQRRRRVWYFTVGASKDRSPPADASYPVVRH